MHEDTDVVEIAKLTGLSPTVTSMFTVIAKGAKAYAPIGVASRSARLARIAEAGAWTDAALALVELELPRWHVRRLERDGDDWYCTLSLYPRTSREFDDAVDGRGPSLPLAILDALVVAHRQALSGDNPPPPDKTKPRQMEVVWCENVR